MHLFHPIRMAIPLALFCCLTWFFSVSFSQDVPIKAVNLGGWLVVERWMYQTPSIFNRIVNDELLDGNQVQLKSTKFGKYLSAEPVGGAPLVANRMIARDWETFRLWRIEDSTFKFRLKPSKQFVRVNNGGIAVVSKLLVDRVAETFTIVKSTDYESVPKVRLRASNGRYLQANTESSVTADYEGDNIDWADQNPSVFKLEIVRKFGGEYQLTNGYGPVKAPQIMRDHWNSYITKEDFRVMSESGLNAVRIPVGWWIMYDMNPPRPFVGGSLQALDNAFTWAQNYNMKVIVDLHAVSGSQNGNDHSGTRDGEQEWGYDYIDQTVAVIDFLAQRYAAHPSLLAIELLNEPQAPGVTLDALSRYYQEGYNAVRKYSKTVYVILSNRLGIRDDQNTELLKLASSLSRSVIDVHYYNVFDQRLQKASPAENINYIYNDRAAQLREVTQTNGPLSFVGEWTAEWLQNQPVEGFVKAQMDVYGKATFGWAFWSYKNVYGRWSLEQLIKNKIINING